MILGSEGCSYFPIFSSYDNESRGFVSLLSILFTFTYCDKNALLFELSI